jgi:glucose/arabinose dehydrogenase
MDRGGEIFRFVNDVSTAQRSVVLDLRSLFTGTSQEGQSGLMDIAFHPDFINNGELYVSYTVPGANRTSYVARYTSSDKGASFSQAGEILLSLPQHNIFHGVGTLFFGQDGYLYVSFGDAGDRQLAQDPFSFNGKILRIDVDGGTPYGIPPDNPFANGGGAPEVYAMGLRNPWRISQDTSTGEIWAGDVGRSDWEEVNKIVLGGNYGWPIKEGAQCTNEGCDSTGLIDPVYAYSHDDGCAVIGGHVYRGSLLPSLIGKYIFSDVCTGKITALQETSLGVIVEPVVTSGLAIRDFSEAPNGEHLIITGDEPRLLQLQPDESSEVVPNAFPGRLSATGCFDPLDPNGTYLSFLGWPNFRTFSRA